MIRVGVFVRGESLWSLDAEWGQPRCRQCQCPLRCGRSGGVP